MKFETKHKQASAIVKDRENRCIIVQVDEKLVQTIQYLWDIQVYTRMSCQDNKKKFVWIMIDIAEVIRLIDLAQKYNKKMYSFLTRYCNYDTIFEPTEHGIHSSISVSMRFPKQDLKKFETFCKDLCRAKKVDNRGLYIKC